MKTDATGLRALRSNKYNPESPLLKPEPSLIFEDRAFPCILTQLGIKGYIK